MQPGIGFHRYTARAPEAPFAMWPGIVPQGHCRHCGQPSAACCCGCRECRKEAKELLVTPGAAVRPAPDNNAAKAALQASLIKAMNIGTTQAQPIDASGAGTGTSFIGGGCCVTLAVEYAPSVHTAAFVVLVHVLDSEGTALLWARSEPAGTGYRVHECIITTKPGATLNVEALNCTARVRWCEVFSC